MQQALARAEVLADLATLGWALIYASAVSYLCGTAAAMQTHTAALEAHATTHGLAVIAPIAAGLRGWLAVQQGQPTAGLAVLAQLAGQVTLASERYRLQGVLLAVMGQSAAAESCLYQALTVARRQSALSLELRVALALARLAPTPERNGVPQHDSCWPRCMAGSRKALTRPICKRHGCVWIQCPERALPHLSLYHAYGQETQGDEGNAARYPHA